MLSDGSSDDSNATTGQIHTRIVAGFVELYPTLRQVGDLLTIGDPSNQAAAILNLRATVTNRSSTVNQIGYLVLNPDELTTPNTLLTNLTQFKARAQILVSTLEGSDVTLAANTSFDRDIQLINGQSLQFFEITNGSLDALTSLQDSRLHLLNAGEVLGSSRQFTTPAGVAFSVAIAAGDPGLGALISQEQGTAPVLDFSAFNPSETLQGTVVLAREASFDAVTGFYRTLDASGAVRASNGLDVVRPGDPTYTAEALRPANRIDGLSGLAVADNQTNSRPFSLQETTCLAPFAQVHGDTFFAYARANVDGIGHFLALGNNMFGLEDLLGGGDRDFDDLVLGFKFTSVS